MLAFQDCGLRIQRHHQGEELIEKSADENDGSQDYLMSLEI